MGNLTASKKGGHDKSRWISLKRPSGSLLDQRQWISFRRPVDHFYVDDRRKKKRSAPDIYPYLTSTCQSWLGPSTQTFLANFLGFLPLSLRWGRSIPSSLQSR